MFRFTICDLLWLTVVVAVLCGWWLDRSKRVWSYGKARETIANLREKLDRADPRGDSEPLLLTSQLSGFGSGDLQNKLTRILRRLSGIANELGIDAEMMLG